MTQTQSDFGYTACTRISPRATVPKEADSVYHTARDLNFTHCRLPHNTKWKCTQFFKNTSHPPRCPSPPFGIISIPLMSAATRMSFAQNLFFLLPMGVTMGDTD